MIEKVTVEVSRKVMVRTNTQHVVLTNASKHRDALVGLFLTDNEKWSDVKAFLYIGVFDLPERQAVGVTVSSDALSKFACNGKDMYIHAVSNSAPDGTPIRLSVSEFPVTVTQG